MIIKYNCNTSFDEINHHTYYNYYKTDYTTYIYTLYIVHTYNIESNIMIKRVSMNSPAIRYDLVNSVINIIFVIFISSCIN